MMQNVLRLISVFSVVVLLTATPGAAADLANLGVLIDDPASPNQTLGSLATARGILFGTYFPDPNRVGYRNGVGAGYTDVGLREFSAYTIPAYFHVVEQASGVFDFTLPDQTIDAVPASKKFRGHTLAWCTEVPAWLQNGNFTADQLTAILVNHVTTVIRHYEDKYPGRVVAWDVVNEPVSLAGAACVWHRIGLEPRVGKPITDQFEYIRVAMAAARQASATAKLYINDYGVEGFSTKSNDFYSLLAGLKAQGVPLDGAGFQAHFNPKCCSRSMQGGPTIAQNMSRLAALGLEISITEADFAIPDGSGSTGLAEAAMQYRSLLRNCLASPSCKAFVVWGVGEPDSWINDFVGGYGNGMLFDANYNPTPAYYAVKAELAFGATTEAPMAPVVPVQLNIAQFDSQYGGVQRPEWGGWAFYTAGGAQTSLYFPMAGTHVLTFSARGDLLGGTGPLVTLGTDYGPEGSVYVQSTAWAQYSIPFYVAFPGEHTVWLDFYNDAAQAGQDRNLYLGDVYVDSVPSSVTSTSPFVGNAASMNHDAAPSSYAVAGGWGLYYNGDITAAVALPFSSGYRFSVQAYGTQAANIWPLLTMSVDSQPVVSTYVSSPSWTTYTAYPALTSGQQTLDLNFSNDGVWGTQDRNLFLGNVTITDITPRLTIFPVATMTVAANSFERFTGATGLYSNGTLSGFADFRRAGMHRLVVTARSSFANGEWAKLVVGVGGQEVTLTVDSATAKDYDVYLPVYPGYQSVSLSFINDYVGSDGDRNVWISGLVLDRCVGADCTRTCAGGSGGALRGTSAQCLNCNNGGVDSLYSPSRSFRLAMQTDGNLVLYRTSDNQARWCSACCSSGTYPLGPCAGVAPGGFATMEAGGNFCLNLSAGAQLWCTGTASAGSSISMQDDGNLVIYAPSGAPLWASNTATAANGVTCSSDAQCTSGACECTNATCSTRVCAAAKCSCKYGVAGACTTNLSNGVPDPDTDCAGANACYAGVCKLQNGVSCAADSSCGSGFCECTNSTCSARVCAAAQCICRYGAAGACTTNLSTGYRDPDSDCAGANACYAGVCKLQGVPPPSCAPRGAPCDEGCCSNGCNVKLQTCL